MRARPPSLGSFSASFLGTLLACACAAVPAAARPLAPRVTDSLTVSNPGYWSPPVSLGFTGVHLALLPSANGSFHSRIVAWQSSGGIIDLASGAARLTTSSFLGGDWGWSPPVSDTLALAAPTFVEQGALDPGGNILCAGHADLPDGRLFVYGGHVGNDTGTRATRLFDASQNLWTRVADMHWRRWYGTATTLADGRMLATSGSAYHRAQILGGLGPGESVPSDSIVHRFALADSLEWDSDDPPVSPGSGVAALEGHALVDDPGISAFVLFGGRGADGALRNDVHFLYSNGQPRAADDAYQKVAVVPAESPPSPRARHAAAALADGSVIVFGGLGSALGRDTVFDDVWRLWGSVPCCGWHWSQLAPSGVGPGPRWGHAMLADPRHGRLLVFGGAATPAGTALDDTVWALTFPAGDPDHPSWSALVPGGAGAPAPRVGHSWTLTSASEVSTDSGVVERAYLMGGASSEDAPGSYQNDAWVLSIGPSGAAAWSPVAASGAPPARVRHASLLDPVTGRMLVYGGRLADGSRSGEVWALPFEGGAWTLAASGGPAREGAGLVRERGAFFVRQPEVYDLATDSWHLLANATLLQQWYPFMFVMPGGGVFAAGPDSISYALDVASESWRPFPATSNSHFPGGNAVMYRPGMVMKCGSRDTQTGSTTSVGTTAIIDVTPGAPDSTWTRSSNDMQPRTNHNLVLLPSGEVLAVGGCGAVFDEANMQPVFQPELWNPEAGGGLGEWYGDTGPVQLAPDSLPRCYHSTAVLLPDGSVLSAGGNVTNGSQIDARVYFPPYLFDAGGAPRPRPTIGSAPRSSGYGEPIDIATPEAANIDHACLIRAGAATHGFDENERYVPLPFTPGPGVLHALLPADSTFAPPGEYLLFIVDAAGTPSIATWLRLHSAPNPAGVAGPAAASRVWLSEPAPNPARGAMQVRFALGSAGLARLEVFDASGRRVRTLASGWRPAGTYAARWDGRSDAGLAASPGMYFCRLSAARTRIERRVALVR